MLTMKPRVAHVIDGLGSGGAEALLVTNLRHLQGGVFEHVVVLVLDENSPIYTPAHFWASEVRALGIEIIELRTRRHVGLSAAAVTLAWALRRNRISLVHTHLLWAGLVGRAAAMLARVPSVSSIHTLSYEAEVLSTYRSPTSLKHDVARALEGLSLRQATALIAVGQTVLESAVARLWVPAERIRVIFNPVDFAALDASVRLTRDELLKQHQLASSSQLIVNVARVTAGKNQVGLVEALARLQTKSAHLVVLGGTNESEYVAQVKATAERLAVASQVHLLGPTKEVASWLAASDVFAFPTQYEGLPVALIEAAGNGCCCVVSGIPANREVVEDGISALVVDQGDPTSLASALETALGDASLRQTLGQNAKARTRARFSVSHSVEALTSLYCEVLHM